MKKKAQEKPVSLGGLAKEALPFPIVHYPNHYGTFFAFAKNETSSIVLCACSKTAVSNFLRLKQLMPQDEFGYGYVLRMAPLDSFYFPDGIAKLSLSSVENPLSILAFESGLCHRCNGMIPTMRYCVEMYGNKFVQQYGWYINQAYLRLGILPFLGEQSIFYLPDVCPAEFQQAIMSASEAERAYQNTNSNSVEEWERLKRESLKKRRTLINMVENLARDEFGYKRIGESWVAETLLYYEIRQAFAPLAVLHHASPDWLGKQHLDIFIPELRIAVEYQGLQHDEPVEYFGGKAAFEKTRIRDEKKQELCKKHDVKLILIKPGYVLDEVVERIRKLASNSERQ